MGTSFHKGPVGENWRKAPLLGTLRDRLKKKRLWKLEHLFLWELCNGTLEGGPLYLGL